MRLKNILTTYVAWCLFSICRTAAAETVWQSGFEKGYPGTEWLDFDNGTFVDPGSGQKTNASHWTIIHRGTGEPVFNGNYSYKGWITRSSPQNHRAYPGIHIDAPTPLINSFMVYLDADYTRMNQLEWIHLGTWGNHDPTSKSGKWALHTISVRDGKLEFAHVKPFHGEYIGPSEQAKFPTRQWVRMTIYMHYQGNTGFVQAWQDGVPTLRALISQLEQFPGTRLRTAHWGMYASGTLDHGIQYNDDIRICTLNKPLTNLQQEPVCPAGRN